MDWSHLGEWKALPSGAEPAASRSVILYQRGSQHCEVPFSSSPFPLMVWVSGAEVDMMAYRRQGLCVHEARVLVKWEIHHQTKIPHSFGEIWGCSQSNI